MYLLIYFKYDFVLEDMIIDRIKFDTLKNMNDWIKAMELLYTSKDDFQVLEKYKIEEIL